MAEETIEQPRTAAEADDFAEYKKLRKDPPSTPQSVVKEADSPADGVNSASGPQGESGSASDAGDKEPQKKLEPKPKKDRSLEARFSDLTNRLKTAEEGRLKLERELQELRNGNRSPEAAAPQKAETVKTPPAASDENEPDFRTFMKAETDDPANKTYEDALAIAQRKYWKAMRDHERSRTEADSRRSESERQQAEVQGRREAKMAKARVRYADFDAVMNASQPPEIKTTNPGLREAIDELDNGFEAAYELVHNFEEAKRISNLPPRECRLAMLRFGFSLENSEEEPKSNPTADRQPVRMPSRSNAPAPARTLSGTTSNGTAKRPAEASNYTEYKKLRAAK